MSTPAEHQATQHLRSYIRTVKRETRLLADLLMLTDMSPVVLPVMGRAVERLRAATATASRYGLAPRRSRKPGANAGTRKAENRVTRQGGG